MELSKAVIEAIDHWLTKYPADQRRSAVVGALFAVQEDQQGWLTQDAMQAVAEYLKISAIEVYEVATFYDMFELSPVGQHKISVCTNISCMLRGSDQIVAALETRLGIGLGETSADGRFTLKECECLAACANAPVCQVDDKAFHEDLTPETAVLMVDGLLKGNQS